MSVCLDRLFQESEKERKEQESQERQQAAQIAAGKDTGGGGAELCCDDVCVCVCVCADLSLIAGTLRDDESAFTFDPEFALSDVMNSDPMLTFEPGIT